MNSAFAVPNVIIDMDLSSDIDDVADITVLNALADLGECNILGALGTADNTATPKFQKLVGLYHGRDYRVGFISPSGGKGGDGNIPATINSLMKWNCDYEDGLALYRDLLERADDKSVIIITTGGLSGLMRFMKTEGALELVRRKVDMLCCAGGCYPRGSEFNFNVWAEGTDYVLKNWPCKAYFDGYDVGQSVFTGQDLFSHPDPTNPTWVGWNSYKAHQGSTYEWGGAYPTWSQVIMLYGIRMNSGAKDFWDVHDRGRNTYDGKTNNAWDDTLTPPDTQGYLLENTRWETQDTLNALLNNCINPKAKGSRAVPNKPTNLKATVANGKVTLTWMDNSWNEDAFQIQTFDPSARAWIVAGEVGPNARSFVHAPAQVVGAAYRVAAKNGFGLSDFAMRQITENGWRTVAGTSKYFHYQDGTLVWPRRYTDAESVGTEHTCVNDNLRTGREFTIDVHVGNKDGFGCNYLYFLWQDENNWYRIAAVAEGDARAADGSRVAASRLERCVDGKIVRVGEKFDPFSAGGSCSMQTWKLVVNGRNIKFHWNNDYTKNKKDGRWYGNNIVTTRPSLVLDVTDEAMPEAWTGGKIAVGGGKSPDKPQGYLARPDWAELVVTGTGSAASVASSVAQAAVTSDAPSAVSKRTVAVESKKSVAVEMDFVLETRGTAMNFRREGETWLMEQWGLKGPTAKESAALAYHPDICYDEIGRVKPWTYSAFGAECWRSADVNKFGGLAVEHADGTLSLELCHVEAEVVEEKGATHLAFKLKDAAHPFFVTQHFVAWRDCDAIETWIELRHDEAKPVRLSRMDSLAFALPLRDKSATLYSLTGDWAAEGQLAEAAVVRGQSVVLESRNVTRSAWGANPAFMLSMGGPADERTGRVIGCALAWTGAFRLGVRHDFADTYELRAGVDSPNGAYVLEAGRTLTLPKAILVYGEQGKGGISRQFHRWARNHCMPHGRELRPILLNSWEGCYHHITEPVLLSMMDGLKDLGGELFVVDDGWYGRGDYGEAPDDVALGDWTVDPHPLPHGLAWLADQAKARGLKFGLWVEPEMGGTRSHLVQEHPDWVLRDQSRPLKVVEGSTRVVLDLPNPAVRENIFRQLDTLYASIPGLAYVKWDCNVNLQNPGSPHLPADRQANLWFDYGAGLRELLARLHAKHPDISVQACSSGGAHMDYGGLATADEFWTSDDTDARERVFIQWGASQFYPAVAMGAHVTASPNHQTGRETPLKFRLDVAMTGRLGFELHPAKLTDAERAFCRKAVADYKRIRPVVQQGDLYRLVSPYERDYAALSYVAEDQSRATVSVLGLVRDMHSDYPAPLRLEGLDPEAQYRVREINVDGAARHTRIDGQVFSGAALMHQGFYPLLARDYDSFTLELVEEPSVNAKGNE